MIVKIFILVILSIIGYSYIKEEKRASTLQTYASDELRKGAELENKLSSLAESKGYKVLSNIIIPNLTGRTTEVDILIMSTKGFYAIEAKNYFGYVAGNKEWKKWTVTYNKEKGIKRTFLNPINQNLGHIRALRAKFPRYRFNNLVVFGEKTKISKELFKTANIMTCKGFEFFLNVSLPKKDDVLTTAEVESVYDFLCRYKDGDRQAHIEFVQSLKKKYAK